MDSTSHKHSADTIAAIATPPGQGGVGILRLSGALAGQIGKHITGGEVPERRVRLAHFLDAGGRVLDQGLAVRFRAPASFTGEDVVELHAHGSPVVLSLLLDRCLQLGARIAAPGEFSERAFLNGKLDLVQAEAIADLIASGSEGAARAAVRSLQGAFSSLVRALDDEVRTLRAELEASLDFADESEVHLENARLRQQLGRVLARLREVLDEAKRGATLNQRIRLVLAGAPNVGKSSLLNRLVGYERAIVSAQPGTTRDILDAEIRLAGLAVEVTDTAGLRTSGECVEAEGVRRAREAIKLADVRIDLWDATRPETRGTWPPPKAGQRVVEVMNKSDLVAAADGKDALAVSAKTGTGIAALRTHIETLLAFDEREPAFLARARHVHALERSQEHLAAACAQQRTGDALELVAEELRAAHLALGEIVGVTTTEDLLGEIFRHFCLGK